MGKLTTFAVSRVRMCLKRVQQVTQERFTIQTQIEAKKGTKDIKIH